jgi:hypothetical protein
MVRALDTRLCHPGVAASSSSGFATLLSREPDLLVCGFDRSLLRQAPIGHGVVGRSGGVLVGRDIGTTNRATAPQGWSCFPPVGDI